MKFLGLYLENYGSFYGRHYIPLADRGVVSVLGENLDNPRAASNGAGKSTWSDAWDWCLWGEHPRGDSVGSVVNDEAKKGCCVTVDVVDDFGRLIRIQRLRDYAKRPNGPRLWINGAEVTALDASQTQREIEKVLGLDREVFHAAVLFGQEDKFRFADATDGERKALLTKLIPELGEVDALLQRTKDRHAAWTSTRLRLVADVARLQGHETALRGQNPEAGIQQWEEDRAARLAALGVRMVQVEATHAQLAVQLVPIPVPDALPVLAVPPPPDHAASLKAVALAQEHVNHAQAAVTFKRQEHAAKWDQLKRMEAAKSGTCSQCGQPITEAHLGKERALLKDQCEAIVAEGLKRRATFEQAQAMLAEVQSGHAALEAVWQAAKQAEVEERAKANAGAEALRAQQGQLRTMLKQVEAERSTIQRESQALAVQPNPFAEQAARWRAELVQTGELLAAVTRELAEADRRLVLLDFWVKGFGQKGLKSFLLDGKVAEMAQEANRWVSLLTGGTTWVEFSTQRMTGTGSKQKLVEDLSVRVFRANPDATVTERGYRSWSGGEKYRVSLGIDFGLARLVAKRARCSYDVLVLDELFGRSLDATGKAAVAEMLQALAKEKSSVFVIDHEANFQHLFDSCMVVRKLHRRSRVVGGMQHGVEPIAAQDGGGATPNVLADHPAFPSAG